MGSRETGGAGATTGRIRTTTIQSRSFNPDQDREMDAYLRGIYNTNYTGRSEDDLMAIDIYQSDAGINNLMREAVKNGRFPSPNLRNWAIRTMAQLDSMIINLPDNTTLYRGGDIPGIDKLYKSGKAVGSTIDDAGYLSTSLNRNIADEFTNYTQSADKSFITINARKNTRAIIANQDNEMYGTQREIILARAIPMTIRSIRYNAAKKAYFVEVDTEEV